MTKRENLHAVKPTTTVDEGMGKFSGLYFAEVLTF